MKKVIGVRFKEIGKIYYFNPMELEIEKGSHVVVETSRGIEYGLVVIDHKEINKKELTSPLKKVIRVATEEDDKQYKKNTEKENASKEIFAQKVQKNKLNMKLVEVEVTFDLNKIIFYFTADGRIDFRELVKDLAAVLRMRIELRQIGVRDEAKILNGVGICGRTLCCATFLGDFQPVSIKMAKEQNLSLNPTKISGVCGRLMCCLKYEEEAYEYASKTIPPEGSYVETPIGRGNVVNTYVLKQQVRVAVKSQEKDKDVTTLEIFDVADIKVLPPRKPKIDKNSNSEKRSEEKHNNSEKKGNDRKPKYDKNNQSDKKVYEKPRKKPKKKEFID